MALTDIVRNKVNEAKQQSDRLSATPESFGQTLNGLVRDQIGRDLNSQEINSLLNLYREGTKIQDIASRYVADLNNRSDIILTQANALGIEGFSKADADAIRDQIYRPGSQQIADQFNDLASAALSRVVRDRMINPQVNNENTQAAARVIQETLGRPATQDELAFFSKEIAKGESPYELAQFLQQSPEYIEAKAKKDREAINQELLAGEEEVFARAQPQIISSFMKAGRLNSSGLQSALANARAELARERQSMLTGYAREDVVGARNQAFQNYLRQSDPRQQAQSWLTQSRVQAPFQQLDAYRSRGYELDNYYRQQSDFNRALGMQQKANREAGMWGLAGNVLGAGAQGAMYGWMKP